MSADFENDYFVRQRKIREKPPLWDSFQDPPAKKNSGSSADWKIVTFFMKMCKVFTYISVLAVILASSVLSKVIYIFMTGNIKNEYKVNFCARLVASNSQAHYTAELSKEEKIAWVWALIFAFAAPEVFTFLRALRIYTFKDVKSPTWLETVLVMLFELFHVVGLALLTFTVLPQLDATRAAMICNCVCFVPALLCLFSGTRLHWKSVLIYAISVLALLLQCSSFLLWPAFTSKLNVQIMIVPLVMISFRWWENYANSYSNIALFIKAIKRTRARYQTYLYLAPLKILVFALLAFLLHGEYFVQYFSFFERAWQSHDITIRQHALLLRNITTQQQQQQQQRPTSFISTRVFIMQSNPLAIFYALLVQVFSSYLCYVFGKFACKIKIQEFSFSLPLSLSGPVTVVVTTLLAHLRASDVCALHAYIPDYLTLHWIGNGIGAAAAVDAFDVGGGLQFVDAIYEYCLWLWPFWWLSQLWTCTHIWQPRNDKNAPTEKLFVCPWYCGLLVDQCIMMNRRIVDWNDKYMRIKHNTTALTNDENKCDATTTSTAQTNADEVQDADKIPQLIVCATMWHETQEEMMEFLKSIVRMDEDQCARRMARIYINGSKTDDDYYELETNIYFDDAFVLDELQCENARNPPLNEFVKMLVKSIDKAAFEVYGLNIRIKPPIKIETPYGGRLVWTLPGRSKLIAHLKNKDKIRHKKRWSQVMYMYYLLGFRIMELDALSPRRKAVIAENTFILALDGDIDFQPRAVHLLIDRMKAIDELGAACGRIHPVGRGPMVWYQIFEYSIGHWLQKATEHVIGCVLCSPGCFSLFRASALMENSVMKKYTTVAEVPMHYVQYDQGEDRWLCTLLLKQGWRVEYSAASDAYTHAPEIFNEFYNQRRRWVPSTIANIFDILGDASTVVKQNNSISMPYIMYQGMLMVGTVLGPGTIFLMMVGALVAVFNIGIWTAFLWNFFPIIFFIMACVYLKQKFQLLLAFVISTIYCLVMMAVLIGVIVQMLEDGPLAPASLFFLLVAVQITVAGLMHPQEMLALGCGIIYYITIPSMYMLLMIYSVFNMNDISWGTREIVTPAATAEQDAKSTQNLKAQQSSAEQQSNSSSTYLPGWLSDPILVDSELGEISLLEKRFWRDLIKQYLKPLFHTKQQKAAIAQSLGELRNIIAFAFVMSNSIFVLIVFLLQLKKDYLHLKWPIDPTDFISFDRDNSQVFIYRQYKELDPIGLCFVIFFGVILIIQFIAMFFHRFATFSQLLASTSLDWFRMNKSITDEDAALEIKGNAFKIARQLQRPKRFDDEIDDDDDDDNDDGDGNVDNRDFDTFEKTGRQHGSGGVRRQTIFKLHENCNKRENDYSDLPRNFERRFFGDEDIKVKNLALSRKSVMLLNERRSMAKQSFKPEVQRNNDFKQQNLSVYDNSAFEPTIEW